MTEASVESRLLGGHAAAAGILDELLRSIPGDRLSRTVASCPGWDLRNLVDHVVGGAERYAMLLEGATAAEVESTRERDYAAHLGSAVQLDLDHRLAVAFSRCSPTARLPHRAGPVDRLEVLRMRILECLLHAWDIATTIEAPVSLDEELCQLALEECAGTLSRLTNEGFYSPRVVDRGRSASQRLLAAAGRTGRPGASP